MTLKVPLGEVAGLLPAKTNKRSRTKRHCAACMKKDETARRLVMERDKWRQAAMRLQALKPRIYSGRPDWKDRTDRLKRQGLCINCGKPPEPDSPSTVHCWRCYNVHRDAVRRERARKLHPCRRCGTPCYCSDLCRSCANKRAWNQRHKGQRAVDRALADAAAHMSAREN